MPAQDFQEIDTESVLRDIRELKTDVQQNMQSLVGITDMGDLTKHLKDFLWPTLEAIVDRVSDVADIVNVNEDAMLELAEGEGDQLTPETSKSILAVLVVASAITQALEQRITPADPAELTEKIATFKRELAAVIELVNDATLESDDDTEDD